MVIPKSAASRFLSLIEKYISISAKSTEFLNSGLELPMKHTLDLFPRTGKKAVKKHIIWTKRRRINTKQMAYGIIKYAYPSQVTTGEERDVCRRRASACTPHKMTISLNILKSELDYLRMIRFKTSQLELRKSLRNMGLSYNLCMGHVIRESKYEFERDTLLIRN